MSQRKKNTCNFSSPQITILLHKTTTITYILLNYKKKKILFWKIWEKREIEMKNKKYVIFSPTVRSIIIWKKNVKRSPWRPLKKCNWNLSLEKVKKMFLGEKKREPAVTHERKKNSLCQRWCELQFHLRSTYRNISLYRKLYLFLSWLFTYSYSIVDNTRYSGRKSR